MNGDTGCAIAFIPSLRRSTSTLFDSWALGEPWRLSLQTRV
jgi:hypothetical protein